MKVKFVFDRVCNFFQYYKKGVIHGDLKCENILLTSDDWLLLGDFAPFKPTQLPSDNPAEFTYFFDTSRRRVAYLAPERFMERDDTATLPETELRKEDNL